ncbi:MAG: DUF2726 domain-containing protein [Proteobacteria bacterium]|nr:DUF2726 domain-containing protein [Pseudomonadota bacterium]
MTNLLLIGLLLLVALLVGVLWFRRRDPRRGDPTQQDRVDTIAAWPPQATRILGKHERMAYLTLTRALPDYMILAQVPLARFLRVPKRHSYAEWLRRLGNQCVDFVVCDAASQVLAVIEIHAPADQANERSRRRAVRIARSLKAADLPLHVWTEGALPSLETVRQTVVPRSAANASGQTVQAPSPSMSLPVSAPIPLSAASAQIEPEPEPDESFELNEPPPSTWYDEFDSGPAPLQKQPPR